MKITNTSKANQGVWTDDGLVHLVPGETRDVKVSKDYVDRVNALPFLKVEGGGLDKDRNGAPGGSVDELDQMKVAALRAVAKDEKVDLGALKKSADIIAAIRAARAAAAEENDDDAPADEDPRSDDELRAAVIEQLGEEGSAELDRPAMLALLAPQA